LGEKDRFLLASFLGRGGRGLGVVNVLFFRLHSSLPCLEEKVYKKEGWEPIHKKYKANKSTKTQVTKEHNNQDIT
jgi:hypothetical protein